MGVLKRIIPPYIDEKSHLSIAVINIFRETTDLERNHSENFEGGDMWSDFLVGLGTGRRS